MACMMTTGRREHDTPEPKSNLSPGNIRMTDLSSIVRDIAERYASAEDRGEVARYIPQLAGVDPGQFGIAVVTRDGEEFAAGDASVPFSIQSISRVFALSLALIDEDDNLWRRVGREPSGQEPFRCNPTEARVRKRWSGLAFTYGFNREGNLEGHI